MPAVLYSAPVVCPMTGPPLPDGGVLVERDRIIDVGPATALRAHAAREHHVEGVLLPGFVNAHTQLEHTDAVSLAERGALHRWREALDGMTRTWEPDRWARSAQRGVHQLLRAGITCVGDVVTRGPAVPAAARAGLAGDSWIEVAGVDVDCHDEVLKAVEHALGLPAPGRRVGVAPASPVSLGTGVLQALAALARRLGAPLHISAASTQAEVRAVWHGDGPVAESARRRGYEYEWLDGGTQLSPVRYLAQCGALYPGTSIAQGVWVADPEVRLLAEQRVAVVCCPRANELLEMGDAPLALYAQHGVRLALGTGGAAAGGAGLDILAEAAAWVRLARRQEVFMWPSPAGPVEPPEAAIRLATVDGARAMGWADRSGVLAPGRRADIVGVGVATTCGRVFSDLVAAGAGRQVLTVVAGVRKARRDDPDGPWPDIADEEER